MLGGCPGSPQYKNNKCKFVMDVEQISKEQKRGSRI